LPQNAGDFRLIDRAVIDQLRKIKDNNPYLRGTIAGFGFPQTGIVYDRAARAAGRSKFNFFALMRLAIDGICSQSTRPLEWITIFGFSLSLLTIVSAVGYASWYFLTASEIPPGFTTLVFLILVTTGINAAILGLIGEYVGRIFKNTREIPMPIIDFRIEHPDIHEVGAKDPVMSSSS
jgi:hypothetical protein